MKCPRCESTTIRKNGHPNGKQRYLCKMCGRQFFDSLSSLEFSHNQSDGVQIATDVYSKSQFHEDISPPLSPQAVSTPHVDHSATSAQSSQGIAILLLDVENIKLDLNTEKFLGTICTYPLQVKIAFANWRNQSIAKHDAELYDRGYQLIHVPGGKDSADAKMIAVGSSIFLQYPTVKEVLVCSSDWIFTHLCNELKNKGLTVYKLQIKNQTLQIENQTTSEMNYYSLSLDMTLPSFESLVNEIEQLLKSEYESIHQRLSQLSTVAALFQERCNVSVNPTEIPELLTLNSELEKNGSQKRKFSKSKEKQKANQQTEEFNKNPEEKSKESPLNQELIQSNSIVSITSKQEFEQAVIGILERMIIESHQTAVPVPNLSVKLHKIYGKTANAIVKELKLGVKFTKFLQSCKTFTVTKRGKVYEVSLGQDSLAEVNSPSDLEQLLVNLLKTLTAKSLGSYIPLETLGVEFHKQYSKPVSAIVKRLELDDNFAQFVQSCRALKVEKIGKTYQVAIANP